MTKQKRSDPAVLSFGEKFGYGLGEVASGVTFGLVQSVLQKYYTDILCLPVLSIMTLFLLARFWDAANDTICGHIIARLEPDGTGRYRRWLRWFALPLAASTILMFVRIPGLSRTGYFVYACVTYTLFGMVYTCLNVPYGSLAQAITDDSRGRSSLSVARSVGGVFGAIPALVLISVCYRTDAEGTEYMSYPIILIGVCIIAALSLLFYWLLYRNTVERIVEPGKKGEKGLYFRSIRALLTDRPFMVCSVAAMLYLASQQFSMSYSTYLFQYYFHSPGLTMIPTVAQYLPVAVMMFCATGLGNRFGKSKLCAAGLLAAGLGNLLLYMLHTDQVWIYAAVLMLSGFGTAPIYLLTWALASDAIEHTSRTRGVEEPYAYAFFSFMRKLGHCVAAVCVNAVLYQIGYENNVLNTANIDGAALRGMYAYSVLVPALLYLVIFVLLRFAYPLSGRSADAAGKCTL